MMPHQKPIFELVAVFFCLIFVCTAIGQTESDSKPSQPSAGDFFESKVLPVFQEKCFSCHGGGEKIRAEFVMTNREDLIRGGESGAAVDLDKPMESLLLSVINYESYEMPPAGKLPQSDIDNITQWVKSGAVWKGKQFKPEAHSSEGGLEPPVNEETKQWWSYKKPQRQTAPSANTTWAKNEIDQFISAKLHAANLKPNPTASKATLIRRVYYDLIGLPPSPDDVRDFINDSSEDAYEKLVDRLLDSKHYGEKWGRHWLDLVRYGESNSYERDGTKPFVWRYRDYVIRSLNQDKPYDQFVTEQLAGDEIENRSPDALIATGFYRLGKWDDEPVDREQAWFDDADDILATTGQAFLGMTIDCARCHNHKIDPIPQADYYRMLAFFRNIQRYGIRGHDTVLRQSTRSIAPIEMQEKHKEEVKSHRDAVKANREALIAIEKIVKPDFIPVEHEEFRHEMNRVPLVKKRIGKKIGGTEFSEAQAEQYEKLFKEMRNLRRNPPAPLEAALCVTEIGDKPLDTHVLVRGNAKAKGDLVQPGFPTVLSPPEPEISAPANKQSTGRRTALAKWIASPENPLTARVMVNRIWQHHFGRGIVRTPNDLGFQGAKPTHPKLLDWLAIEFMENGWSLKHMHRKMMTSATYRMSSAGREDAFSADPINDLFWRFEMRRLTAEEIRDSVLAVNQTLNRDKFFGPSIFPRIEREVLQGQSRPGENWGRSSPEDVNRRSIYIHIKRSLPVPLMQSFDVADPDSTCPVRFNTVQPTQALAMINSEFINEQAHEFAKFLESKKPGDVTAQVRLALSRVLQREPASNEIERGVEFVSRMNNDEHKKQNGLKLFCVVALNLNEFLFLD